MKRKKFVVIIRGKGTKHETRTKTNVPMYWSKTLKRWVTIPE